MAMVISFLLILLSVSCIAEFQPEDYDIDPKDAFFRQYRSNDIQKQNVDGNIPQPGGFQTYFDQTRVKRNAKDIDNENRLKRSYHVLPSPGLTSHFTVNADKPHRKTKRQALLAESASETIDGTLFGDDTPVKRYDALELADELPDVVINDFIRFKRNADTEAISESASRLKREPELKTEKMIMDRDYIEGADREPRGATKEQWIKQPYPVERPVEDNVSSASDTIRAPRVHFVTQRRQSDGDSRQAESQLRPQPPPSYRRGHDEREGRARDFDPYTHSLPQPLPYPYPRPRSYDPYRPRYYDPYYDSYDNRRYPYDGYDSRFKYDLPEGRPMQPEQPILPSPSTGNRQRRIIYYATLPEVVRSPTNSDNRFRYQYQDAHDERYVGGAPAMSAAPVPGPANGATDPYRVRKTYNNQLQNQRDYERPNTERKKTPLYPVKVSTDVNVREPKKTPERRIYSDVDRRYNYKAPSFQTAEVGNF